MRPNPGGGDIGSLLLALLGIGGQQFSRSEEQRRQQEAEAQRQKAATDANAAQLQTQITAQRENDRLSKMREQVQKNAESFRNALVLPDVQANPEKQARLLGGFQASMELLNTSDPAAFDRGFTDYGKNFSGILNEADQTVFQFKQGQETNKLLTPLLQRVLEDTDGKYDPATRQQAASIVQDIQSGKSADLSRVATLQANRFDANAFLKADAKEQARRLVLGGMAEVDDQGALQYTAEGKDFLVKNGLAVADATDPRGFKFTTLVAPDATGLTNERRRDAAQTAQAELDTAIKELGVEGQGLQNNILFQQGQEIGVRLRYLPDQLSTSIEAQQAATEQARETARKIRQEIETNAALLPAQRRTLEAQAKALEAGADVAERTRDAKVRQSYADAANAEITTTQIQTGIDLGRKQIAQLEQQIAAAKEGDPVKLDILKTQLAEAKLDVLYKEKTLEARTQVANLSVDQLQAQIGESQARVAALQQDIDQKKVTNPIEAQRLQTQLGQAQTELQFFKDTYSARVNTVNAGARQAVISADILEKTATSQVEATNARNLLNAELDTSAMQWVDAKVEAEGIGTLSALLDKFPASGTKVAEQLVERYGDRLTPDMQTALRAQGARAEALSKEPAQQRTISLLTAAAKAPGTSDSQRASTRASLAADLRRNGVAEPQVRVLMSIYDSGVQASLAAKTQEDREAVLNNAKAEAEIEVLKANRDKLANDVLVANGNLEINKQDINIRNRATNAQIAYQAGNLALGWAQLTESQNARTSQQRDDWVRNVNATVNQAQNQSNQLMDQLMQTYTTKDTLGNVRLDDAAMKADPRWEIIQRNNGFITSALVAQARFLSGGGKSGLAFPSVPGQPAPQRASDPQMRAFETKLFEDRGLRGSFSTYLDLANRATNGLFTPEDRTKLEAVKVELAKAGVTDAMLYTITRPDYRAQVISWPMQSDPGASPTAPASPGGINTPNSAPANPSSVGGQPSTTGLTRFSPASGLYQVFDPVTNTWRNATNPR